MNNISRYNMNNIHAHHDMFVQTDVYEHTSVLSVSTSLSSILQGMFVPL